MLAVLAVCGHPVPSRSQTACISIAVAEIANVVNNEWCNENCADNPNSELCEDKCHCPVVAINKPKETAQQSLGDCVSMILPLMPSGAKRIAHSELTPRSASIPAIVLVRRTTANASRGKP